MPSMRKFYMVSFSDWDLFKRPQLIVHYVKDTQLVHTSNCHVVPTGMEGQSNQRFVIITIPLDLEVKHSQQLTPKRLIVPHPDGWVLLGYGGKQRPLLANIHSCNWCWVKTLIKILKVDFLLLLFFIHTQIPVNQVRYLWYYLMKV